MKVAAIVFVAALALIGFGCARQEVDDAGTSAKVKAKLAADSETSAIKIGVDTVNGVVNLSGVVPTEREKMKAEELARSTEGVVQVTNNITINPDSIGATNAEQKAREAIGNVEKKAREVGTDATILASIKARFLTEGINGTNVDVRGGIVIIKGEVENENKLSLAVAIARNTEGVKNVINQLKVTKKIG
ncbi:MAG: BON domain-containing protein [Acidobacteria bacterium]|nr:BON domain-containing protein [Acidobacteriota bacterium]